MVFIELVVIVVVVVVRYMQSHQYCENMNLMDILFTSHHRLSEDGFHIDVSKRRPISSSSRRSRKDEKSEDGSYGRVYIVPDSTVCNPYVNFFESLSALQLCVV